MWREFIPQNYSNLAKTYSSYQGVLASNTASSANINILNYNSANLKYLILTISKLELSKKAATLSKKMLKSTGEAGQPYFTPLFMGTLA